MDSAFFKLGNKPYGLKSHSVNSKTTSYLRWLEHKTSQKLFSLFSLEAETTGSLVFSKSSESFFSFKNTCDDKTWSVEYLFITDRKVEKNSWVFKSAESDRWAPQKNLISETFFELVKDQDEFSVVRARPTQQKQRTHDGDSSPPFTTTDYAGLCQQVRAHARDSKIPLVGDTLNSGSPYSQHFLHCHKIEVPSLEIFHKTQAPVVFDNLSILKKPLLLKWLMSLDRRLRLYEDLNSSSYRWVHDEGTPLRLDVVGLKGCAGWWREEPPNDYELDQLKDFFSLTQISDWQLMHYSGDRTKDKLIHDNLPFESWVGRENEMTLQFKKDTGLSFGLFLDQRDNRTWLKNFAREKNVLNLFAYTGGFSVSAAQGGATKVTTVDLSKKYIEWAKQNFFLNSIPASDHLFFVMDSMDFLFYAQKKQMFYDVIVCDPPSFSRDKRGQIFRIEKDYKELLIATSHVLSPKGTILFSTNYEKWSSSRWLQELASALKSEGLEITEKISSQWDFEIQTERHMKAFLLKKK